MKQCFSQLVLVSIPQPRFQAKRMRASYTNLCNRIALLYFLPFRTPAIEPSAITPYSTDRSRARHLQTVFQLLQA